MDNNYNDALERARQAIIDCGSNASRKEMIYGIFPELRESEEDKIKETLHSIIRRAINDQGTPYEERAFVSTKVLPYVEKLQERKSAVLNDPTIFTNLVKIGFLLKTQVFPSSEEVKEYIHTIEVVLGFGTKNQHYTKWNELFEKCVENCDPKVVEEVSEKVDEILQKEQKAPKDRGEISDGYHTFNELYYYRMLYNAAFFNRLPKEWVHKSKKHHDGEECFGGGWFIVMAQLPTGQISNHYELKDWDLFQIPEKETADMWDGHTPQEAAERLHKYLLGNQKSAEWSKNDAKMLKKCISNAYDIVPIPAQHGGILCEDLKKKFDKELVAWLKSLPERFK